MKNPANHSDKLQQLFAQDQWSEEDRRWLLHYLEQTDHTELRRLMQEKYKEDLADKLPAIEADRLLSVIHKKIKPVQAKPVRSLRQFWRQVSIAASVMLAIGLGIFVYDVYSIKRQEGITAKQQLVQPDVPPGQNKAMLTLADGTVIVLDSATNGALAEQGNARVLKLDGLLTYNATSGNSQTAPVYNTIATANGNQYQLILSDGTRVWLNAASSIHFPTLFTGNERRVEITGEAYFEVAKNPSQPFRVVIKKSSVAEGEIEVLGTHFNVNAYDDESEAITTLVEGSVKVKKANSTQLLEPGQEARLVRDGRIALNKHVDVAQVVAWKDGYFWFDNTDLRTLMRQVARWYDVEVIFEGKIQEDGFSGKIPRNVSLSKLLKILELNEISCRLAGRKIIVMP